MLAPGTRLGPYEILSTLGAGGMGEVYRARDAKLHRDVAIKFLPDAFAADRERLARFEREAQTLAALNHPNIAQIYAVLDDPPALVMELVDGEDLAARLSRGAVPLDETIAIARQIADALEAAHDQGIVHRDLKPANVKIRPDGTVKVLDFGLAKAADPAASGLALANSPTFTAHTQLGVIVGTAAYMAPEQARGRVVDRRADVWAFGVVLYEMLAGRPAFVGDNISDVLASVLKNEPVWTTLPVETPASIRRLLRRCLDKDPRRRLSAIGDARFDLDDRDAPPPPAASRTSRRPYLWAVLAATIAIGAIAGFAWARMSARETAVTRRLSLLPPADTALFPDSACVAISPDGTMVAFVVGGSSRSDTQLWVRSLDSMTARRLDGTEGGTLPFWSPDSRQIGFFTTEKLKTVPAAGGRPQTLADLKGGGRGGTWSRSDVIVYAPAATGPLYRIPAAGGTPEQVTTLDASLHQVGHRFPSFLPDGDHFLYVSLVGKDGRFGVFVGALSGGAPVHIADLESAPVYAPPGYLLYSRQGVLVARPFDPSSLGVSGDPIVLTDEPSTILDPLTAYTAGRTVSVASDGTLLYYSAPSINTRAVWFDTLGHQTGTLPLPPGHYENMKISPDGTQAAFVRALSPSESSLWLIDLARGGATELTTSPGMNDLPVWSRDGAAIAFVSDRSGAQALYLKSIGDAAPERVIFRPQSPFIAPSWFSADGASVVLAMISPDTGDDVWLLPKAGAQELTPLVRTPARDIGGIVSPDGRWLAYDSDVTGRFQLYVQSFPEPGRRVQVTQYGALGATWSRDGRQLCFVGDDGRSLWRAEVTAGSTFSTTPPVQFAQLPAGVIRVDMTPDLQRFLALLPERTGTGTMTIVQNWTASLGR